MNLKSDKETSKKKLLILVASHLESNYIPNNPNINVLYTGVGKLNAYKSVQSFFQNETNDINEFSILNIGTCGSPFHSIGNMVVPREIKQGDTYVFEGFQHHTLSFANSMLESFLYKNAEFASCILTSDQFINTSSDFYRSLQCNDYIFDMECYSFALYANQYNIPFFCIKFVSDNCDGTVKDWDKIVGDMVPQINRTIEQFVECFIRL